VGWWKNGYPEYFAKVLNAPNWIGIDIEINESLDLNTCTAVKTFVANWIWRKAGTSFFSNASKRYPDSGQYSTLSIVLDEVGIINYEITLNKDTKIIYKPYIDAGVTNEDANWDENLGTSWGENLRMKL
jgi:maltose phosphorylase